MSEDIPEKSLCNRCANNDYCIILLDAPETEKDYTIECSDFRVVIE